MSTHPRRALAALAGALIAVAVLPAAAAGAPGALTPLGQATGAGGLRAVAVSPDGRHVYAAAQAESRLTAYRREAGGLLTQVDTETDGSGGVQSLGGALSVAVSPDGLDVYVAAGGDGAVTTFNRNATTGALTLQGCVSDAGAGGCDAGPGLGEAAPAGSRPGTSGLGLEIVRRTVAALGGDVGIDTGSGRGTRVTVRLPLLDPGSGPHD